MNVFPAWTSHLYVSTSIAYHKGATTAIGYSIELTPWAPSRIATEMDWWSKGIPVHLKQWLRSWKSLRGNQTFEVQRGQPLGAPLRTPGPGETWGWSSRAFLYWHTTNIPMQRKEAELQHKGILHLEDMFSKQQNIFVMNVTYVVLSLCLAGDKKNRSKAKWKQNGAYRHRGTITVLCLISI